MTLSRMICLFKWGFSAIVATAVIGCQKDPGYRSLDYEIVAVDKISKVPQVPTILWDEWMKEKPASVEYGRLKVYFIEETPDVLGKKNFQVQLGEGGGQVDLADFVNPQKAGLWSLALDVEHADEKEAKLSVFFVSSGKRRKLGGQVFGSGCGRVLEVSTFFKKSMKRRGIEMSSASGRDVSAIGGTFYFVVKKAQKMWLSRLTVGDRYRSKYLCAEASPG